MWARRSSAQRGQRETEVSPIGVVAERGKACAPSAGADQQCNKHQTDSDDRRLRTSIEEEATERFATVDSPTACSVVVEMILEPEVEWRELERANNRQPQDRPEPLLTDQPAHTPLVCRA